MNFQFSDSQPQLDKAMTTEQFNQIVEAILAGKYSWACVLILRFAGYNPLHYIPYTTYIRLSKENQPKVVYNQQQKLKTTEKSHQEKLCQLTELDRLETLEEDGITIRGGDRYAPSKGDCFFNNSSFPLRGFRDEFLSEIKFTKLTTQNYLKKTFYQNGNIT
jgi:hypothetical protein